MNSDYDGSPGQTFELGVQFESNVAGEVTGVLFYKQRGMTGTNVGHLWSSNGTLLASATFSNETSSGWQHVSFSNPVSIPADTFYTVSYTTGSPLFYFESGYFAKGGVTNGNLTAPSSTDINGTILDNGVYNYGGDFPIASQYYANFWVDLVFTPSSGDAIPAVSHPAKQPVQPAAIVTLTAQPIERLGHLATGSHAGRAGVLRRRIARNCTYFPRTIAEPESGPTAWGDRVVVQEALLVG